MFEIFEKSKNVIKNLGNSVYYSSSWYTEVKNNWENVIASYS